MIDIPKAYYDYFTHAVHRGAATGKTLTVPAELHQIPLFIRGGSIVPTRERPRRSAPLMKHDPFTLRVALDKSGAASGTLYLDDGESYAFEQGDFVWRALGAETKGKTLRLASRDVAGVEAVGREVALDAYRPENAYAQEIAAVLRETLSERHDLRLEWIIILLIAIEVVFEMGRWVGEWRERRDPESTEALMRRWLEENVNKNERK